MLLAVDVAYGEDEAQVAGIVFERWESQAITNKYMLHIEHVAEYESGQFYKRELPCILKLLAQVQEPIDMIIIDGYVTLGETDHYGLGQYLFEHLEAKTPVIGVAKNIFQGTPKNCEILRGQSIKPLYITAAGIELETAKNNIQKMFGKFRLPDLLKQVDQLSRA